MSCEQVAIFFLFSNICLCVCLTIVYIEMVFLQITQKIHYKKFHLKYVCVCKPSCLIFLSFSDVILQFRSLVDRVKVGTRQLRFRISRCGGWSRLRWSWLRLFGIDRYLTTHARLVCLSRFILRGCRFRFGHFNVFSLWRGIFFPKKEPLKKPGKCGAHQSRSLDDGLSRFWLFLCFSLHSLLKWKLIQIVRYVFALVATDAAEQKTQNRSS